MWRQFSFSSGFGSSPRLSRALTFLVWVLVAYTAWCWGLRIWSLSADLPVAGQAQLVEPTAPDSAKLAQALGASVVAPTPGGQEIRLVGVVASDQGEGVALIAVGADPAKPFRVGQVVANGLVVQNTFKRKVQLAPAMNAQTVMTLELPLQAQAPSLAVLPPPGVSPSLGSPQPLAATTPDGMPPLTDAKIADRPDSGFPPRKGSPAP